MSNRFDFLGIKCLEYWRKLISQVYARQTFLDHCKQKTIIRQSYEIIFSSDSLDNAFYFTR